MIWVILPCIDLWLKTIPTWDWDLHIIGGFRLEDIINSMEFTFYSQEKCDHSLWLNKAWEEGEFLLVHNCEQNHYYCNESFNGTWIWQRIVTFLLIYRDRGWALSWAVQIDIVIYKTFLLTDHIPKINKVGRQRNEGKSAQNLYTVHMLEKLKRKREAK